MQETKLSSEPMEPTSGVHSPHKQAWYRFIDVELDTA